MRIEVLYFAGCPGYEQLMSRLEELLLRAGITDPVERVRVESVESAAAQRFLGSPTLRIDGLDVEPAADQRTDYGLQCRLYACAVEGHRRSPADDCILAAIQGVRSAGGSER